MVKFKIKSWREKYDKSNMHTHTHKYNTFIVYLYWYTHKMVSDNVSWRLNIRSHLAIRLHSYFITLFMGWYNHILNIYLFVTTTTTSEHSLSYGFVFFFMSRLYLAQKVLFVLLREREKKLLSASMWRSIKIIFITTTNSKSF